MALTLKEHTKGYRDPFMDAVVMEFEETAPLLRVFPFENVNGGGKGFSRQEKLPGVEFRAINGIYQESTGVIQNQYVDTKNLGGDIDIDKKLIDDQGTNRQNSERQGKSQAAALRWVKEFIKGDETTDPNSFNGLQQRIVGSQLEYAGGAAATVGAPASIKALLDIKRLVQRPTHWLMNEQMKNWITIAAMNQSVGGYITVSRDAFGDEVTSFSGIPIVIIDYDENGDQIMEFNEANPDGTPGTNTSIYCISAGPTSLVGIQGGVSANGTGGKVFGPRLTPLGLQSDGHNNVIRDRLEWYTNFIIYKSRSVARLAGIADAQITLA